MNIIQSYDRTWLTINLATQKDCVEHFAGRLLEYLIMNITAWDKLSIQQLVGTVMEFMNPSNGDRYAEFYHHFRSTMVFGGPNSMFNHSIYAIWQKLAPFRHFANGNLLSQMTLKMKYCKI